MSADQFDQPISYETAQSLCKIMMGRQSNSEEIDKYPTLRHFIEYVSVSEEHFRNLYATIGHYFFYQDLHNVSDYCVDEDKIAALMQKVRESWTQLGTTAPHWSVMANPKYLPGNLDVQGVEEFYWTGSLDIHAIRTRLDRLNLLPPPTASVLDFGCGVGRLGQHLAAMFGTYTGVDISRPHMQLAEGRLRAAGLSNFVVREIEDFLSSPPESLKFDLVVSLLTLQHNPPPVMLKLFEQLLKSIAPNGISYIQFPTYLHDYTFDVLNYINNPRPVGEMEMHALPQHVAFQAIRDTGCEVVEVVSDGRVGSLGISAGFIVRRPPAPLVRKTALSKIAHSLLGR